MVVGDPIVVCVVVLVMTVGDTVVSVVVVLS